MKEGTNLIIRSLVRENEIKISLGEDVEILMCVMYNSSVSEL